MSKRGCIEIEEMLDALALPPDHPRRRHLERCPRCASLLASLQHFLEVPDLPAGADLDAADRRLSAALERQVARPGPARSGPSFFALLADLLRRRPLVPIGALAALAIVVIGVRMASQAPHAPEQPRLLRGDNGQAQREPVINTPRSQSGGGLLLSWAPADRAQAYRVAVFRPDMSEVAGWESGPACSLALGTAALEPLGREPGPLYLGVTALRGRDEIARSPLRVFTMPEGP